MLFWSFYFAENTRKWLGSFWAIDDKSFFQISSTQGLGGGASLEKYFFICRRKKSKDILLIFFFFNTWKGGSCLCLVFHLYWILEMSIETQSCKIKLVQKGKLSFVWFRSNWCLCLVPVRTGIKFIKLTTIDMMTIISYIGDWNLFQFQYKFQRKNEDEIFVFKNTINGWKSTVKRAVFEVVWQLSLADGGATWSIRLRILILILILIGESPKKSTPPPS